MRIATWNVNSIKAREQRLLSWLAAHPVDVLCLQELKVTEEAFPFAALEVAGYAALVHGQKTYNGVAILARAALARSDGFQLLTRGMDDDVDDSQARLLAARVGELVVLSAYAPNGGEVGSDKWQYKLSWLRRLRDHLTSRLRAGESIALCGDLNIAPEPRDVCDPAAWQASVLYHPSAREAFAELLALGLGDAFRKSRPEAGLYSWWDYRMLGFPRNQGLRIDHVLVGAPLLERVHSAAIDRDERKGQRPSDHAPVIVELD